MYKVLRARPVSSILISQAQLISFGSITERQVDFKALEFLLGLQERTESFLPVCSQSFRIYRTALLNASRRLYRFEHARSRPHEATKVQHRPRCVPGSAPSTGLLADVP